MPVFLLGKLNDWGIQWVRPSSLWGHKELELTEWHWGWGEGWVTGMCISGSSREQRITLINDLPTYSCTRDVVFPPFHCLFTLIGGTFKMFSDLTHQGNNVSLWFTWHFIHSQGTHTNTAFNTLALVIISGRPSAWMKPWSHRFENSVWLWQGKDVLSRKMWSGFDTLPMWSCNFRFYLSEPQFSLSVKWGREPTISEWLEN